MALTLQDTLLAGGVAEAVKLACERRPISGCRLPEIGLCLISNFGAHLSMFLHWGDISEIFLFCCKFQTKNGRSVSRIKGVQYEFNYDYW